MKALFAGLFILLSIVSGIIAKLATPIFIIKLIYDVFIGNVGFWSAVIDNAMGLFITLIVSIFVFILSGGIAKALVEG